MNKKSLEKNERLNRDAIKISVSTRVADLVITMREGAIRTLLNSLIITAVSSLLVALVLKYVLKM